jgi:hypothetical protein
MVRKILLGASHVFSHPSDNSAVEEDAKQVQKAIQKLYFSIQSDLLVASLRKAPGRWGLRSLVVGPNH